MNTTRKRYWYISIGLLATFLLLTVALHYVDVAPIGPRQSVVGFATINQWFHNLTGVHMTLYIITDWLGLVPIGVALTFAILGLVQWIRRRHIQKVDRSILLLGGFYLIVIAVYVLFEYVVINRRPILIDGFLEASYPSSTTMLVMCVMPTAMMQCGARIKNSTARRCVTAVITAFITFMVIGRLLSGVHWLSDIIGGALFSTGMVILYHQAAMNDQYATTHN